MRLFKAISRILRPARRPARAWDYVLNQAAWGSVPRSIEMPQFYCMNNIVGMLNMLEAVRQCGVKKFVYASSSSVYGDEPNLPKTEGREGNLLVALCADKALRRGVGQAVYHALRPGYLRPSLFQ